MRVALEALIVVGGSLFLFRFLYRGILDARRRDRAARQAEREHEEAWLDSHINPSSDRRR